MIWIAHQLVDSSVPDPLETTWNFYVEKTMVLTLTNESEDGQVLERLKNKNLLAIMASVTKYWTFVRQLLKNT